MQEPNDRIWLAEQDFERNGGIEHSDIVIRDESVLGEIHSPWRVTEYRRVSTVVDRDVGDCGQLND